MTSPFMNSYVKLLIKTCHKRGVHAMGGMAAQIPIKNDKEANEKAMIKVRNDKLREVKLGHDGTWVAHPDLIKIALEVFNEHMQGPNQIYNRTNYDVKKDDLLNMNVEGSITNDSVQVAISISMTYIESWLKGVGCVPIFNLMEDAATAEISRSQLWQWKKHNVKTFEGKLINDDLIEEKMDIEINSIKKKGWN